MDRLFNSSNWILQVQGGDQPPLPTNGNSFVACSMPKVLHAPAECVKLVIFFDLVMLARITSSGLHARTDTHTQTHTHRHTIIAILLPVSYRGSRFLFNPIFVRCIKKPSESESFLPRLGGGRQRLASIWIADIDWCLMFDVWWYLMIFDDVPWFSIIFHDFSWCLMISAPPKKNLWNTSSAVSRA